MKKKNPSDKPSKDLAIKRATIRNLTTAQLSTVGGGCDTGSITTEAPKK